MIFLLLSAIYFLNVLSRMLFSMWAPQCFSLPQLGSVLFSLALGFGSSLFFSQFLAFKISHRKMIAFSGLFSALLLFVFPFAVKSQLESTFSLIVFFFTLGSFSGLFLPSAIVYLGHLFPEAKLGRAIGFFSSFQTLAMISAPLVSAAANIESFPFLAAALFSLSLVFLFCSKPTQEKSIFPDVYFFKEVIRSPTYRSLFVIHSLAMGLNVGVYLIAPAYFLSCPNLVPLLSLSRFLGIFGSILCGYLVDFFGLRMSLSVGLVLSGICTSLLGVLGIEQALFLSCLQGPLAIGLTTLVYASISKIAPPGRKGSLISLFASSSFLMGAGIIPQSMMVLGAYHLFSTGFIALGFFSLFFGIHFARKKWEIA